MTRAKPFFLNRTQTTKHKRRDGCVHAAPTEDSAHQASPPARGKAGLGGDTEGPARGRRRHRKTPASHLERQAAQGTRAGAGQARPAPSPRGEVQLSCRKQALYTREAAKPERLRITSVGTDAAPAAPAPGQGGSGPSHGPGTWGETLVPSRRLRQLPDLCRRSLLLPGTYCPESSRWIFLEGTPTRPAGGNPSLAWESVLPPAEPQRGRKEATPCAP